MDTARCCRVYSALRVPKLYKIWIFGLDYAIRLYTLTTISTYVCSYLDAQVLIYNVCRPIYMDLCRGRCESERNRLFSPDGISVLIPLASASSRADAATRPPSETDDHYKRRTTISCQLTHEPSIHMLPIYICRYTYTIYIYNIYIIMYICVYVYEMIVFVVFLYIITIIIGYIYI